MDTQDGFIVGVYNYCDRWCERCSLASRCRVYAEELRMSLELPAGGAVDRGEFVPAIRSLGAVAATFAELADQPLDSGSAVDAPSAPPTERKLGAAALELQHRVQALGMAFWKWIAPESRAREPLVVDAVEVLQHYGVFIGPKVYRALSGRAHADEDGLRSDALGSAKAALLALERLGDAWLRLAEHGVISVLQAAPVLTELQHVVLELERLFPGARDFVRPGFDEPEAVAMLEWRERG